MIEKNNDFPSHRLRFETLAAESRDLSVFEEINNEAIPENERASLSGLFSTGKDGNPEVTGIYADDTPAGFFAVRKYKSIIYLAFLAVKKELRSRGVGSMALSVLKNRYKGRMIITEFDAADADCADNEKKIRRKRFYLKNGFYETGWYNYYDQTEFEIVCAGPEFDISVFEEFTVYLSGLIGSMIPKPYKK